MLDPNIPILLNSLISYFVFYYFLYHQLLFITILLLILHHSLFLLLQIENYTIKIQNKISMKFNTQTWTFGALVKPLTSIKTGKKKSKFLLEFIVHAMLLHRFLWNMCLILALTFSWNHVYLIWVQIILTSFSRI